MKIHGPRRKSNSAPKSRKVLTPQRMEISATQRRKNFATVIFVLIAAVILMTTIYALQLEWTTEPDSICKPPSVIFFLKVHKCASSSVQNMLLRLSERLSLPVALPERCNYFGHPRRFRADMVFRPAGAHSATYRMLAHHMRLDPAQVKQVIGPDATWLTVLRRPVDQFISMFEYYHLQDVWNMTLAEFAASPTDRLPAGTTASHFFPNQMSFDLGYDVAALLADDRLQEAMLDEVLKRFALVLIAELLDESLVLLKYRLCLDWDDVVAFRHNVRPPSLRPPAASNSTLRRQLRHHLTADSALYHHFHQRLRQALREYGAAHVRAGLQVLHERVVYWTGRCRGWRWNWPGEPEPLPPRGQTDAEREVWMCSRLFAHELTYTEHLRATQEWDAHWRELGDSRDAGDA